MKKLALRATRVNKTLTVATINPTAVAFLNPSMANMVAE